MEALSRFSPNQVSKDDILDALAATVTGVGGNGRLVTTPEEPERDSKGLPMEMVYYTQN
jgi:predicted RNase H-like nuclease